MVKINMRIFKDKSDEMMKCLNTISKIKDISRKVTTNVRRDK